MNKGVILNENSEFAQLYKTVILFSAWDKSRDLRANWNKLEHMYTTKVIAVGALAVVVPAKPQPPA